MSKAQYQLTLHFMESEPVAAARKLELVNLEHAAMIVKDAPISSAVNVLKSMIPSVAAKLFVYFSETQCSRLTESMEITDLAAILRHTDSAVRESTIKHLPKRKQTLCLMLITYPEYTIGSAVETDLLIVDSHMAIQDVLLRLKKRKYSYLQWLYVVNQSRQLLGKVFIGDVFREELHVEIGTIAQYRDETVSANTDMISAIELDVWNHTDTLVVVNKKQEFLGVIHQHKLRNFMSVKLANEAQKKSVSSDLLEIYGDTIVNMVDLIQHSGTKP